MNQHYKKIKKSRKWWRLCDHFSKGEQKRFQNWIKKTLDECISEINSGVDWTEGELRRIEELKVRRRAEKHYNRWG